MYRRAKARATTASLQHHIGICILFLGSVITLTAISSSAQTPAVPSRSTDLEALTRDPSQWVMPSHDYASTRFSTLDQINTRNAGELQVAWTFSVGADRGQEAAPLVVNNTMYAISPYAGPHPNEVFALDATKPVT